MVQVLSVKVFPYYLYFSFYVAIYSVSITKGKKWFLNRVVSGAGKCFWMGVEGLEKDPGSQEAGLQDRNGKRMAENEWE